MWMSSRSRNEGKSTESGGSQKRRRNENSHRPGSISGHSQLCEQQSQAKKTKLSVSSFEDDVSDNEFVVIELFSSDEQEKSSKTRSARRSGIPQDKMPVTKNNAENSQVSPIYNSTSIFKKFQKQSEKVGKEKADTGVDSEPMFTQQQEDADIPLLPWPKKVRKPSGQTSAPSQNSVRPIVKEVHSNLQKDFSSDEDESFASILNKKMTKRICKRNSKSTFEKKGGKIVSLGNTQPMDDSAEISPGLKRITGHNQLFLKKKTADVSSDSFSDVMVVETSEDSGGKKTNKKEEEDETDASDGFVTIGRGKHFIGSCGTVRGTQGVSQAWDDDCQAQRQRKNQFIRGFSDKKKVLSLRQRKIKTKTRKSFKLTSSSEENDSQQNGPVSDDDLSCHSTLSSDDSNFASTLSRKTQTRDKNKNRSAKSYIRERKDSAMVSESDEDTENYENPSNTGQIKHREARSQSNLFVSQNVREKLKQSISCKFRPGAEFKIDNPYKSFFASKESANDENQRLEKERKPCEVAVVVASDDAMTQPPESYVDSQEDSEVIVIGLEEEATQQQGQAHQEDDSSTLPLDLPTAPDLPWSSDDDATQPLELDPQLNDDDDLTQSLDQKSDDELTQPPSPSVFGDPPMLIPHTTTLTLPKNSVSLDPPELSLQLAKTMSLISMNRSVSELKKPPNLSEQLSLQEARSTVSPASTIAHDSDSEHSSDTETFPDLDENSKRESVKALEKISSRSGGSNDSIESQSCLTFKPIIVIDDGKHKHDENIDVKANSEKLRSSNIPPTESKSDFTPAKSVTFDLDIPIDEAKIKKEVLSEDSQRVKDALPSMAPCYTQEEDVIFVYDSSDDEALLDLSQTNVRSDHLSDDLLDLFDHSDTELFDDDFNHDKTVPVGDQSSTLEELAQENKNPFDHLGESDSDDALITERQTGADLDETSRVKEKILEISSDTDNDDVMRSPHSPFVTSGHESCEIDMNEDMYFGATDLGELLDSSETRAKVIDVFAVNTEVMGEVPQSDTDIDIYNASTEVTSTDVTSTDQSDATAHKMQARMPNLSSRKTKRLSSCSLDMKVKLKEKERAETTSDEDLFLAATQMDTSVASLLRQNTLGEPEADPKTGTDSDSESEFLRAQSITPSQVKPKRKTASVKKLNSSLKRTVESSTMGKSVSFSSGAFGADTQLDDSTHTAQNSFSTSTPKVTQTKLKTSLFQMKSLSFKDLYSAQTQVMPQGNSKSEECIDESLEDDADAALCSAVDDLEKTCLTSVDSKKQAHSSKMVDQYMAATQVMSDQVPSCIESEAGEEEEFEDTDVYGACTQVVRGSSPCARRSLADGDEELDMYGAATQVDPILRQDDVIVLDDLEEMENELDPFDVMTQVDLPEPDLIDKESNASKSNVPVSLLKRIQTNHIQKKSVLVCAQQLNKCEVLKDKVSENSATKQLPTATVEKSMFYPKSADKPSWLSKKKSPPVNVKSTTSGRRRRKQTSESSFSLTQKIQVAKARQKERMHKAAVDPSVPIAKMKPTVTAKHGSNSDVVLPDEDEIMAKGLPLLTFNKLVAKHKDEKRQTETEDSGKDNKELLSVKMPSSEHTKSLSKSPNRQVEEHKCSSSKSLAKSSSHSSKSSSRLSKPPSHSSKLSSYSSKSSSRSSKSPSHLSKSSSYSSKSSSPSFKSPSHSSKSSSYSSKSSHSSKSPSHLSKLSYSSKSSHSSKSPSHSSKSSSYSSKSSRSSKSPSHSSKSSSYSSKSPSHSSSSGKSSASSQSRSAYVAKKVSSSHSSSHMSRSSSSSKHHSSKSSHSSKSYHHSSKSSGHQKREPSSRLSSGQTSQTSTPQNPSTSSALPSNSQPVTRAIVSSSPNPVSAECRRSLGNYGSASPERESIVDMMAREVTSPGVTKSSIRDKSFDLSLYPLPARVQAAESENPGDGSKASENTKVGDNTLQTCHNSTTPRIMTVSPIPFTSLKITGVKEPRKTIPINIVGPSKTGAANFIKVPPLNMASSENRDPRLRALPVSIQAERPNLLLKPSSAVPGSSLMQKPTAPSRGNESILPFSQVLRGAPATASTVGVSVADIGSKRVQEPAKLLDPTYYMARVLQWNPIWLHEQMKPEFVNHPPPVLQPDESVYPLLESYTSLEDYQDIMTRLLLLETWDTIFKEWKQKKVRRLNNVMFMSFDILNKQDKAGLGKFVWQGLLNREQMRRGQHPLEGELVIMNVWGAPLPTHKEGMSAQVKSAWKATFGYVERVNIRPATNIHNLYRTYPILKSSVEDPRGELHLMTITALARYRRYRPIGDRVMSIEALCNLVTARRQFQALTYLPRSPLFRDILNPSSPRNFQHSTLIQDKDLLRSYNLSQAEAISAVCRAVQEPRHVPRICLLQGPPGTGKTHTITGIITKIIQDSKGKCCICLCTPSNGAADELTRRLIAIRNGGGQSSGMRLVRFGKMNSMHDDVKQCAYDELLEKERAKLEQKRLNDLSSLPDSVKREQKQLRQRIERLQQEVAALSMSTSKIQIDRRTADIRKLEKELYYLDRQQRTPARQHVQLTASEMGRLRQRILEEAHVICGTLNSIGSARIMNILRTERNRNHFMCTIIDEATQSTELDCLIPLQYGTSKLVLVGDPEQLPPTIISKRAKEMKFGLSLFERFYTYFKLKEHNPVLVLKTQYRMDAAILTFPNLYVYDGLLNTDRSVAERTKNFPLHPYLVFNNESGQETISAEGSVSNQTESNCVADLCHLISSRTNILPAMIGVICPYQSQKTLVINSLNQKGLRDVEVNTVDGFQGREKHVIIMSCVRARSSDGSIGFLSDRRRLNVALTRAKYALFVIGHLDSLKRGADWRALIEDAQRRNVIINIPTTEQFSRLAACCFKTNSGTIPRH